MKKFTKIASKVLPLPLDNVDTDMILPAQYMTDVAGRILVGPQANRDASSSVPSPAKRNGVRPRLQGNGD